MHETSAGRVLDIVRKRGHVRLPEPVQLASGEWSQDFIDGKAAMADGDDLRLACDRMLAVVAGLGIQFDAVGGLTMGADQFSHGLAILGHAKWFVVRKEPKGRGTNRMVEGAKLAAGVRVLLVDDVVTTGGSILRAYDAIASTKASVVGAVTLVDRGEHAAATFERLGIPYASLVTYRDLGIEPVGGPRQEGQRWQ